MGCRSAVDIITKKGRSAERPFLLLSTEGYEEYTTVSAKASYSGILRKKKKREMNYLVVVGQQIRLVEV